MLGSVVRVELRRTVEHDHVSRLERQFGTRPEPQGVARLGDLDARRDGDVDRVLAEEGELAVRAVDVLPVGEGGVREELLGPRRLGLVDLVGHDGPLRGLGALLLGDAVLLSLVGLEVQRTVLTGDGGDRGGAGARRRVVVHPDGGACPDQGGTQDGAQDPRSVVRA